jgi:hypothetical protein
MEAQTRFREIGGVFKFRGMEAQTSLEKLEEYSSLKAADPVEFEDSVDISS